MIEAALVLAEYDLIVLEPSWVLRGLPGARQTVSDDFFAHLHGALLRRRNELPEFFDAGGIMVVSLEDPCTVSSDYNLEFDSYQWWVPTVGINNLPPDAVPVVVGSGEISLVTEPGHPFGLYLEVNRTYHVRLRPELYADEHVIVLAENRLGQPVALEVPVDQGLLVLVTPPADSYKRDHLMSAARNVHEQRAGRTDSWRLAAEHRLEEERDRILAEMRVRREAAELKLQRTRELRQQILQQPHVARAIRYFERATEGTPTPKKSLPHLYNLVEVIEQRLGGKQAAAKSLGISSKSLERIKRLANEGPRDIRHAPTDSVAETTWSEFSEALSDAKASLKALIEYEANSLAPDHVSGPSGP